LLIVVVSLRKEHKPATVCRASSIDTTSRQPSGGLFVARRQQWWNELPLSASEKLRVRQDLTILTNLIPLIEEVEAELCRLSTTEQWVGQVPYLV
jgi:hypothetical protein